MNNWKIAYVQNDSRETNEEILSSTNNVFRYLNTIQVLICCFANRAGKVSMGYCKGNLNRMYKHFWHSKTPNKRRVSIWFQNITSIFGMFWTEPPFRDNLLFECAQSGPELTSFSGSIVQSLNRIIRYKLLRDIITRLPILR